MIKMQDKRLMSTAKQCDDVAKIELGSTESFERLEEIIQPKFSHSLHGGDAVYYEPPTRNRNYLALYKFASCYFFGLGVDANSEEATKWLKASNTTESGGLTLREGSVQAKIALGICYLNGDGIEVSIDEAMVLFEDAARKNDAIGCLWLAYAYYLKYSAGEPVSAMDRLCYMGSLTVTGLLRRNETLTENEISDEDERDRKVRSVLSLEERMSQYIKESAINFMYENTSYDDSFIVPDIVFPENIVDFLKGDDSSSAKVILAFYYRSINNEAQFLSCLNEADNQLDIIASYELGLHYEKEKSFDKAVKYFEKIISTDKSYTYPLETTKHVKTSAEHEIKLIEYKYRLEEKNKELKATNERLQLETKQKEISQKEVLEKEKEMLSFFTHTMRNALATAPESLRQAIQLLGSDDYETDKKHYKAINKIVSLFSTLSLTDCLIDTFKQSISEPEEFQRAWQNDNKGEATPKWVLAFALRQSLNRIIFLSDTSELRQLLSNADTSAIISTRKSFIENILPLNLENKGIESFYQWLNNISTLDISIEEDNNNLSFGVNQVKFSLLFSITSELLLNALKYWNGTGKIQISWYSEQEYFVFKVTNPCQANASSNLAGTHKGLAFIKRLIDLLGEQASFTPIAEEQSFSAEFKLHQSLLNG